MNRIRFALIATVCFMLLMSLSSLVHASSSTNYEIRSDVIGTGGNDTSSSASYELRDSVSVNGSGASSSSSYNMSAGYRQRIFDEFANFIVKVQNRSSQVAATSLSGTTVAVTNVSGFSVGNYIVVIQDEGQNQVAAVGKIASISSPNIIVDSWTTGGVTPTIDSSNDVVYSLDASTASLGTLADSIVATGIIAWEVNVDNDEGYNIYVLENDDLKSGSDVLPDVTDGLVSSGVSEYGGRSSDTTLSASTFDTSDTAFTSTAAQVGSRADGTFKSRDFLTLKAAIINNQVAGTYSHTLTFVYVGDY
ncbi:MAG: hypothetical protein ABH846_04120 [Patescibacteria group bacterium]